MLSCFSLVLNNMGAHVKNSLQCHTSWNLSWISLCTQFRILIHRVANRGPINNMAVHKWYIFLRVKMTDEYVTETVPQSLRYFSGPFTAKVYQHCSDILFLKACYWNTLILLTQKSGGNLENSPLKPETENHLKKN